MSKEEMEKEINYINNQLDKLGFINKEIISSKEIDTSYIFTYKLNNHIKYIDINLLDDILALQFAEKSNYNIKNNTATIPFENINGFLNKLTVYYMDKGYSFSKISLINYTFKNNKAYATLQVKKTKQRIIDKLIIKGYEDFPEKYVQQLLPKNKKIIFNKKSLETLATKLNSILFISIIKKPQVLFLKDSTLIYVYLKKKKVNQFDGLIGFASNNDSEITFNGYLNLNLNNIFNKGERINLLWKSTENVNKQFDLNMDIPYIFNTRISPVLNLSIYSQDSSFVNIKSQIKLDYHINYKNKIGAIVSNEKSTVLLTNEINSIKNYTLTSYGVNYSYHVPYNNSFYKTKLYIDSSLLYGKRKQKEANFNQKRISFNASYIYSINNKNLIFLKSSNSILLTKKYITNELDRIGGTLNIRGFKNESILSSRNSIVNFEYNYLPNRLTSLYAITDYAYTVNDVNNTKNNLFGFGLGYRKKLKSSILDFSYTVSKIDNHSLNFKNAVVNIKYVSFF